MIDWRKVAELREEIGKDDFLEVVELFLEEADEAIDQLRNGLPEGKWESCLHFLKGSALNLGFHRFSELCSEGETAAATGHFSQVAMDQIIEVYDLSRAQFLTGLSEQLPG